MSTGLFSSHVTETPQEIHAGACTIKSWIIVNRKASELFVLCFDKAIGDVIIGNTNPLFVIPVAASDKSEFSFVEELADGHGLTIAAFGDREATIPSECDVLVEYAY